MSNAPASWPAGWLGGWVVALAAACGPPGDAKEAALEPYEAPGGQYRVWFLQPPWKHVEAAGTRARFIVESNAASVADVRDAGIPPKYELDVTVEPGDAEPLAKAAERRASSRGEEIVQPPRPVRGDEGGVRGWELLTAATGASRRNFRFVYLDRVGGGVVHLRFEADPDLGEPEVDAMIRAAEVDPES